MHLSLGTLARSGLEAVAHGDLDAVAHDAAAGFAAKLRAGRAATPIPRFIPGGRSSNGSLHVFLDLDAGDEATLLREAERSGVGVEDVGAHAVMVYLAEREALELSL